MQTPTKTYIKEYQGNFSIANTSLLVLCMLSIAFLVVI